MRRPATTVNYECAMAATIDRRKRQRVPLHWSVQLARKVGTQTVETVTENLSSEGFFCIIKEQFKQGERLHCVIITDEILDSADSRIRVHCDVTVRRVEELAEGFGMACHIENYSILTGLPPHRQLSGRSDPHGLVAFRENNNRH
jgi:hypothetical protein